MKLVLAEPRLLKESVNIISELVNEVTFKVSKDKIELLAMDPASVAMVDFKMLAPAFVEYDVQKPCSLSISLEGLKSILKRAKPTDAVQLSLDEDRNRLNIEIIGDTKRSFTLSLLNIDENEVNIPKLSYSAKIEISSAKLEEAVEDMNVIAESVALVAEQGKFTVKSESNLSDAKVDLSSSETVIELTEEKASSKYSIEYLKKMVNGCKLAETTALNFGNDYPLRMEFLVLDKLKLSFILAPRVNND